MKNDKSKLGDFSGASFGNNTNVFIGKNNGNLNQNNESVEDRLTFTEAKRVDTFLSQRIVGIIELLAAISTILSFLIPAFKIVKSKDYVGKSLKIAENYYVWIFVSFVIFLFLLALHRWLKAPQYGFPAFGWIVSSKESENSSQNRVSFVKIEKDCPICKERGKHSKLKPKKIATKWTDITYSDGHTKRRIDKRELYLVCKKYPNDHQWPVDTTTA